MVYSQYCNTYPRALVELENLTHNKEANRILELWVWLNVSDVCIWLLIFTLSFSCLDVASHKTFPSFLSPHIYLRQFNEFVDIHFTWVNLSNIPSLEKRFLPESTLKMQRKMNSKCLTRRSCSMLHWLQWNVSQRWWTRVNDIASTCRGFKRESKTIKDRQSMCIAHVSFSRPTQYVSHRIYGTTHIHCFSSIISSSTAKKTYSNAQVTSTRDESFSKTVAYSIYPMARCSAWPWRMHCECIAKHVTSGSISAFDRVQVRCVFSTLCQLNDSSVVAAYLCLKWRRVSKRMKICQTKIKRRVRNTMSVESTSNHSLTHRQTRNSMPIHCQKSRESSPKMHSTRRRSSLITIHQRRHRLMATNGVLEIGLESRSRPTVRHHSHRRIIHSSRLLPWYQLLKTPQTAVILHRKAHLSIIQNSKKAIRQLENFPPETEKSLHKLVNWIIELSLLNSMEK